MLKKADYSAYVQSANYIKSKIKEQPEIAIILGSGLGGYAEAIENPIIIPYKEIPNFPVSTVCYQKGELIYGTIRGKKILVMNGRFHFYEGYEMWETAYPIGVFSLLGIQKMIITNAAGGINAAYHPGDLVCVTDHVKLSSNSPLRGANIPEFGERFFDMQGVYRKDFIRIAKESAQTLGFSLQEGIYGYMSGPQYETPAEIRMLKTIGADLVGMSTVAEIIFAAQCKISVLCLSCVSNMAAGITGSAITEEEVLTVSNKIATKFQALVTDILSKI